MVEFDAHFETDKMHKRGIAACFTSRVYCVQLDQYSRIDSTIWNIEQEFCCVMYQGKL